MKISHFPILLLSGFFTTTACSSNENKQNAEIVEEVPAGLPVSTETESAATSEIDINSLPISDKELGEFPFFSLPEGVEEMNKPIQRSFDRLFFPINGKMEPIEGKVWKSYITLSEDNPEDWSFPYYEKSFDEAIKSVGGVKIFDAKVSQEELDRIDEQATYFGEEGSIDYWNEPVKVYVIRRAQGDDVYIQLSGNSAQGELQILQKAPLKQTITTLKSDQNQ